MDNSLKSALFLNPQKHISILGFFNNYPVNDYFMESNSVLFLGKSDYLWAHISSNSRSELSLLLAKYHRKTRFYYAIEDWMVPLILEYGSADWTLTTRRYILENSVHTDAPAMKIQQIDKSYASFIHENSIYNQIITPEYIVDRLSSDISAGIMVENIMVAWGFTHDDGALGFLHVQERYRKQGYGRNILLALIQQRRTEEKPVFDNIVPGNTASEELILKLGFKPDMNVRWMRLNT